MDKCRKRYLVLLGIGLLVIIAAGVWMIFGRKTQIYEKTDHAGTWYDMEYGKGYAPDYNNEQMIQYHKRAVNALGEHFGRDGLVSYIELGSLGHWGMALLDQ